jgi:hypothetical protein
MQPNADKLLKIAGITSSLIGFYDAPNAEVFEPFAKPKHCIFACYKNWLKGDSLLISEKKFTCMGAGYWLCGVKSLPRDETVKFLAETEGLKCSSAIMNKWLDNHHPYKKENKYIIISPLKKERYDYLKTVTFFVNPDQLSLLITACEYHNASIDTRTVSAPFGSGCGQLAALFESLYAPQAIIGATDIAMRQYLPPSILALTVTKPMFQQLCELDENSFLYKPFWKRLKKARGRAEKI